MKNSVKRINSHSNILFNFICFCTFGQFTREGRKSFIIVSNISNSLIWLFGALLCGNLLFETEFTLISWVGFVLCFRCFFAFIDRFGEIGIAYTLSYNYPISDTKLLHLRLISKFIQPSEWIFIISNILIFCFHNFEIYYAVIAGIIQALMIYLFEEVISYISYKSPNKGLFAFAFLVFETILVSSTILFKNAIYNIVSPFLFVLLFEILLTILLCVCLTLLFVVYKKPRSKTSIGLLVMTNNKRKRMQTKRYSHLGVLLRKEIAFLVKYKISLVLEALFSAVFFLIISEKADSFNVLLPLFFCFELASTYGFNYFGSEEQAFQLTLLSPVSKDLLIRVKSLSFVIVSYIGSLVVLLMSIITNRITLSMQIVDSISLCTLAIATLLIINPLFSIHFFKINGQKNPYGIKSFLWMIFIYILLCSVIAIFYYVINNSLILIVSASFLMFVAIFATMLLPSYYSAKFMEKERSFLNMINNI